MSGMAKRMYLSLRGIYRPRYLALNIVSAVIYYYIFAFIIRSQNYGILLIDVPLYLLYGLVITASILLTVSVYSIRNTRKNQAQLTASSVSAVAVIFGGIFGGCGCAAPLIFGLTALGISSTSLFSLNALLGAFSSWIYLAIILIDIAVIAYYLNKLSKPVCAVRKR